MDYYFAIYFTPDGLVISRHDSLQQACEDCQHEFFSGFVEPNVQSISSAIEENKALIIKGNAVFPKPIQVAVKWEES